MKLNKLLLILGVLLLMTTAVSATTYQVFYKDVSDARVKLFSEWPTTVFNVKLGNIVLSDLGVVEFDNTADLSQALGSAYSTVGAVYLHSPATDFFTINNSILRTKEVWILYEDATYKILYKDVSDARVKLFSEWPTTVFNVKLGNVELGDLGAVEFDNTADLSQALGSAYSTVGAVYLHSPATDFFTINNSILRTKDVWIRAAPSVAEEEQPTQEEIAEEVEEVTGQEVTPEEAAAIAEDSGNQNSHMFVLAKLLVMEKAAAKARNTQAYMTNKDKMEPLLKDIESQVKTLKGIAQSGIKKRAAEIKKTALSRAPGSQPGGASELGRAPGAQPASNDSLGRAPGGTTAKAGFFSRLFKATGNFFTGGVAAITGAPNIQNIAPAQKALTKTPEIKGIWKTAENQIGQMKKAPAFAKNKNALAAIDKMAEDIAQMKNIAEGKAAALPAKKSLLKRIFGR